MASAPENVSMALFCDFENVALGVRDAKYEQFDIKPILERLLLKGSIVVKKAYCDWERYKGFKATMHEANFELIEIPHVRQSGKNSADIRLVVDALDLCYTKSHVNTFVIISGDSDFSPLVSKLRENAKQVIGIGVKHSTSDLLVANCDEFIFYDDLVQDSHTPRRDKKPQHTAKRTPAEDRQRKEELETRKNQAIEIVVQTFEALLFERGDSGKIWASVLKEAIKRRKPDFSESYYGFRAFGNLLEEAQVRGLLEFGRDEKSGAYVYRSSTSGMPAPVTVASEEPKPRTRSKGRGVRKPVKAMASPPADALHTPVSEAPTPPAPAPETSAVVIIQATPAEPPVLAPETGSTASVAEPQTRRRRSTRKPAEAKPETEPAKPEKPKAKRGKTAAKKPAEAVSEETQPKQTRKPATRTRRTRKPEETPEG